MLRQIAPVFFSPVLSSRRHHQASLPTGLPKSTSSCKFSGVIVLSVFLAGNRFDDNAAGFLAHVHGVIQAELGGLEDGGRNAHRGAVAPFLDDGFHRRSSPPCRNIVSRSSPFLVFSPLVYPERSRRATRHCFCAMLCSWRTHAAPLSAYDSSPKPSAASPGWRKPRGAARIS